MTRSLLSCSILGLTIVTLACSGSKNSTSPKTPPLGTVGIVGDQYVSYGELKDNFMSGSIEQEYTEDDLVEFLPIYLDYRGKILDAKTAGYYADERIKDEYELYSKQAAYAFWMEQEIKPTRFNEFKERYDYQLKSKHVLIALAPNASPEDTLEAYNRIITARNEYLAGTSMEELDAKYSTSRNGRSMGGELPWFSVGTTVPEFEDALYALEVGELSMPVRTQFGYHIILLEEKRDRYPEREVSHIFIRRNSDQSKIDEAFKKLNLDTNWNDAVREFSEDTPSIQNNGYIGWVNYGSRYDAAFIDSVMNLNKNNPFSKPIQSVYGHHIFRIDSVRSFKDESVRDEYIMQLLEDSDSFQQNNAYVVRYLLEKYNATEFNSNVSAFADFIGQLDTTSFNDLGISDSLATLTSTAFETLNFTVADYLNYLKSNYGSQTNVQYSPNWFNNFTQAVVDENLTTLTLNEYPEFSTQIKSYQDGLVVYQINEDSVWSNATIDTTILLANYENNLEEYQYDDRYYYYMITSSRDTSLDRAIEFVEAGNSPDSLFARGFRVGVTSDSTGIFQGDPFTLLAEMEPGTISERFEYSGRKGHFLLVEVLPSRRMTFEEAFNRLSSDYQPTREQKWLERIRKVYKLQSFPAIVRAQYQAEQKTP